LLRDGGRWIQRRRLWRLESFGRGIFYFVSLAVGMLYINMGHGPAVYGDPIQDKLFENAVLWLGTEK
jgi:hypothetical protein